MPSFSPTPPPVITRADRYDTWQNVRMATFAEKLVAEEHHLEDIARDGYDPATLAIVLGGIVVALTVIVGLALGVTLAVYYLV
jgi:hypothetical protein